MSGIVVVAPDSFKGTLQAAAAADAIRAGWLSARPTDDVRVAPMADGGEGTLDAIAAAVPGAQRVPVAVTGPAGSPVRASWLRLPDGTGVVELAGTSGIELLDIMPAPGALQRSLRSEVRTLGAGTSNLAPLDAHTLGFGQAIAAALGSGCPRLALAIGSSASSDGGAGLLTALGAVFVDADGTPVEPGARGLADLARADLRRLRPPPPGGAIVLADVTNPLLGPSGAAAVFGPQKGASPVQVAAIERGLRRLADAIGLDPATPGAGAAGGAGYGLLAWGARIVPGAAAVADLIGLAGLVADADVVVTGEGSFDGQSAAGKAPWHVARVAATARIPVALVAGRITGDTTAFTTAVALADLAGSGTAAMAEPVRWLREAGALLARARRS